MKTKTIAALAALFLAAGLSSPAPAAELTKIALGYGIASDFVEVLVAKDEGIFEKHGLDVTMTVFTNGGMTPQALVSNTVQIAFNTGPVLVLAKAGGLDLVVISGISRIQKINPHSALITRQGLTVTKASDLIGKKIAIPGINSSLDMVLQKWLLDNGVRLDQVTRVELAFQLMGDALKSGQIDAAFPVEPTVSRIVDSGAGVRSVDIQSAVNPDFAASFWSTTREWAAANPKAIDAFRQSVADSLAYIKDNPDEAKKIEMKYLHFIDPKGPSWSMHVTPADLKFWIDMCLQLKLIHQPIDAASLIYPGTP